jgi:hypothetical protein
LLYGRRVRLENKKVWKKPDVVELNVGATERSKRNLVFNPES